MMYSVQNKGESMVYALISVIFGVLLLSFVAGCSIYWVNSRVTRELRELADSSAELVRQDARIQRIETARDPLGERYSLIVQDIELMKAKLMGLEHKIDENSESISRTLAKQAARDRRENKRDKTVEEAPESVEPAPNQLQMFPLGPQANREPIPARRRFGTLAV